jgi:drug/metabolite transporter (DMT)-like permease
VKSILFYSPIALVVISTVFYHLFQKATPNTAHPLLALAVTYAISTGICIALLPFFPLRDSVLESLRQLNWASAGLALTVVGIEIGFLLAYRAGWNISIAALVANTTVAAILLPIGLLLFAEHVSMLQIVGMVVCVVGLLLVNYRA